MVVSSSCNHEVTFRHLLEAYEGEHFALQWFLWIQKHSTVLSKFGLSDTNHQRGRQTRSNRSQISQAQACQVQREKNVSWNFEAAPRLKCYLYHNFFFSLSILLSRFKQSKLSFSRVLNTISFNVNIRMRCLMLTSTQQRTWHNRHSVTLRESKASVTGKAIQPKRYLIKGCDVTFCWMILTKKKCQTLYESPAPPPSPVARR